MKVTYTHLVVILVLITLVSSVGADSWATFCASSIKGTAPYTVTFVSISNNATAWNWSFRNVVGNNTEVWFNQSSNATITFNYGGNYSIRLNSSNSDGYNITPGIVFVNVTGSPSGLGTTLVYPMQYINDTRILPNSNANLPPSGNTVSINVTPGAYESSSFVINPNYAVSDMTITATDLSDGLGHTISKSATAITPVKVWYQVNASTDMKIYEWGYHLTPELLLNNDSIVRVDYTNQTNELWVKNATFQGYVHIDNRTAGQWHSDYKIYDNKTAGGFPQPFAVPISSNKQIWMTTHIPTGQTAGTYTGTVWVNSSSTTPTAVTFSVKVLSFPLVNSTQLHGIFYMGKLTAPTSYLKTSLQMAAELTDINTHGVQYPTFYEVEDGGNVNAALQLRVAAGLPTDKLFTLETDWSDTLYPYIGNNNDTANRTRVTNMVNAWKTHASDNGFGTVYFYGMDEPTNANLLAQRPLWVLVHSLGGKVYEANDYGNTNLVADLLDINDMAFSPNSTLAGIYHSNGNKVVSYQNPQMGAEYMETMRRNYGLDLWKSGYDGGFDFAYQEPFGDTVWNDYDSSIGSYRPEVAAYPTATGVIDTLEWEGYREGVDDSRYADTLVARVGSNTSALAIIAAGSGKDSAVIRGNLIDAIISSSTVAPPVAAFCLASVAPTTVPTTGPTTVSTTAPPSSQYGIGAYTGADPIGGGAGYSSIITSGTYTVTTLAQFNSHMIGGSQPATSGQVVFIPTGTNITFPAGNTPAIPAGVTVASDRGYNGHAGAVLKKTASSGGWSDRMLDIGGNNVRVTGLILEGEMFPSSDSPLVSESLYLEGIKNYGAYTGEVIDNNEMRGWSYAAVEVKGVPTAGRPWIHHNYIHHNTARGEGYGTEIYGGDALIEANIYDYNRHDVTGTGILGEKYTFRYNLMLGHGIPIGGNHVDAHESLLNDDGNGGAHSGDTYTVQYNTVYDNGGGSNQMAFLHITDNPVTGAYISYNDIQTSWGGSWVDASTGLNAANYAGVTGIIYQTKYRESSQARMFATNNKWRGTVYTDNTGILWYQGGV